MSSQSRRWGFIFHCCRERSINSSSPTSKSFFQTAFHLTVIFLGWLNLKPTDRKALKTGFLVFPWRVVELSWHVVVIFYCLYESHYKPQLHLARIIHPSRHHLHHSPILIENQSQCFHPSRCWLYHWWLTLIQEWCRFLYINRDGLSNRRWADTTWSMKAYYGIFICSGWLLFYAIHCFECREVWHEPSSDA